MLDTFNSQKWLLKIKQVPYDRGHISKMYIIDNQLPRLCHKQYSLGVTHIFWGVACRLTSNIVRIVYAENHWNYVNLIHGGKHPAKCISSCFNNYIPSFFPLCVQARKTGPKLNALSNRQLSRSSPRYLKGVTRGISYIIELIFNKTLVILLVSLLEIGILLLLVNYVPTLINIGNSLCTSKKLSSCYIYKGGQSEIYINILF